MSIETMQGEEFADVKAVRDVFGHVAAMDALRRPANATLLGHRARAFSSTARNAHSHATPAHAHLHATRTWLVATRSWTTSCGRMRIVCSTLGGRRRPGKVRQSVQVVVSACPLTRATHHLTLGDSRLDGNAEVWTCSFGWTCSFVTKRGRRRQACDR